MLKLYTRLKLLLNTFSFLVQADSIPISAYEADGTGVKQEWWIALCIVACVGQTPWGQISTSQ